MDLKGYVTTMKAAEVLGITDRHVRLLLARGGSGLKGVRAGRSWLIRESSLQNFSRHPTKGRPNSKQG